MAQPVKQNTRDKQCSSQSPYMFVSTPLMFVFACEQPQWRLSLPSECLVQHVGFPDWCERARCAVPLLGFFLVVLTSLHSRYIFCILLFLVHYIASLGSYSTPSICLLSSLRPNNILPYVCSIDTHHLFQHKQILPCWWGCCQYASSQGLIKATAVSRLNDHLPCACYCLNLINYPSHLSKHRKTPLMESAPWPVKSPWWCSRQKRLWSL